MSDADVRVYCFEARGAYLGKVETTRAAIEAHFRAEGIRAEFGPGNLVNIITPGRRVPGNVTSSDGPRQSASEGPAQVSENQGAACGTRPAISRDMNTTTLRPGEYRDGNIIKRRCRACGAFLIKGRCPVSKKDCGR